MGVFDKIMGKESTALTLNKKEAYAAVAVAAVASDGEISQEEVDRAALDLFSLRPFKNSDIKDLANTLNKVAGHIKRRGMAAVLQAAKAGLSKEQMETAFFVAVDLVLADGIVEETEKKFLEDLQRTIELDDETATKIVDVVAIKNRP